MSGAFVTSVAQSIGWEFDRSQTELAVRARSLDLAAARQELAQRALTEAFDTLDDFRAPVTEVQYQPAGEFTSGGWQEYVREEPSLSDRRNLATVFGILVTKAAELTRGAGGAVDEGVSVLGALRAGLLAAADELADVDPTEVPDDDTEPIKG